MPAVTVSQMLAAEASAIQSGWTEDQLLLLAGQQLGHAIHRQFPTPGMAIGYLGKGHNAGDALVALKILRDHYGWTVAFRAAYPMDQCAALVQHHLQELGGTHALDETPRCIPDRRPLLLLDGLLGTGFRGTMREPLTELTAEMAFLKSNRGAVVAAVDLPSGMNADTGEANQSTVEADITFMIGNPKLGLLYGHAARYVGALALVDVEPLKTHTPSDIDLITPQSMHFAKSPRPFDFHKGQAGRVSILAGSRDYTGAAVLAAHGALRAGAGLITLHVPTNAYDAVSSKCQPEIIIRSYQHIRDIQNDRADARVVGCGLGDLPADEAQQLWDWISQSQCPTVIDADALNLIATFGQLGLIRPNHVLTPHPGEFARLAPAIASLSREAAARAFTRDCPAVLLLKGCRTLVTQQGSPLWCNATGTPGMATAGQGDLLAGVIGARLAIGDPPREAAALSAWLCGRAAEVALNSTTLSAESLLPSDVAKCLGAAYLDWRSAQR